MSNGLGLYVSKRIMECLGGSLEVESDPGVKTAFRITFEALKIRGDPSVSFHGLTFAAPKSSYV
jgi:light-regulated signal transduction histidine kinase (bacteriophytochrome)